MDFAPLTARYPNIRSAYHRPRGPTYLDHIPDTEITASYDMDVPAMHLEQHERGIHAVRRGTGSARVTGAWTGSPGPRVRPPGLRRADRIRGPGPRRGRRVAAGTCSTRRRALPATPGWAGSRAAA